MPAHDENYELLDFGNGRKLERFGRVVVDRPCPTAEGVAKSQPELWREAVARYETPSRSGSPRLTTEPAGTWLGDNKGWAAADWKFTYDSAVTFNLQLEGLPSGQVGVFPEQAENWDWIAGQCRKVRASKHTAPGGYPASGTQSASLRVLNLFAYTGGSTLAAAAAGAEVTHVDAARGVVERARANAAMSGLGKRPIRWIVEDAVKFCRRELKRGKQYDAVILDPPSYGHGPKGEAWKIGEDLLPLLQLCGELTAERRAFLVVSCHTPGIGPAELAAYLCDGVFGSCSERPAAGELFLETANGRRLSSGVFARWPR